MINPCFMDWFMWQKKQEVSSNLLKVNLTKWVKPAIHSIKEFTAFLCDLKSSYASLASAFRGENALLKKDYYTFFVACINGQGLLIHIMMKLAWNQWL